MPLANFPVHAHAVSINKFHFIFQQVLELILTKGKMKTCLVYIDDVIIFSRNLYDDIKHVEEILKILTDAGVTLKFAK